MQNLQGIVIFIWFECYLEYRISSVPSTERPGYNKIQFDVLTLAETAISLGNACTFAIPCDGRRVTADGEEVKRAPAFEKIHREFFFKLPLNVQSQPCGSFYDAPSRAMCLLFSEVIRSDSLMYMICLQGAGNSIARVVRTIPPPATIVSTGSLTVSNFADMVRYVNTPTLTPGAVPVSRPLFQLNSRPLPQAAPQRPKKVKQNLLGSDRLRQWEGRIHWTVPDPIRAHDLRGRHFILVLPDKDPQEYKLIFNRQFLVGFYIVVIASMSSSKSMELT